MFNWKKIEQDYPRAYNAFIDFDPAALQRIDFKVTLFWLNIFFSQHSLFFNDVDFNDYEKKFLMIEFYYE